MMHLQDNAEISTHCITFGAPLFANEAVRLHCQKSNFDQQMIHFVGYQDIVPGILSLGHTLSEIKKRARSALSEATGGVSEVVYQRFSKYLEAGANVASYILANDNDVKSDFEVLSQLTSKILSSDVK